MTILERHIVVPLGTALSTVLVQKLRDAGAVALTAGPIVASHSVLHGSLFLLISSLPVLDADSHHTDHQLVLTQDHVSLGTATLGLWDREHRAT